ncbi:MAG TPA: sugar ABC transporter permease [Spirochaetia bacterium]|nr:sugar ABC transporter permease [Spirochaetia bacterium]
MKRRRFQDASAGYIFVAPFVVSFLLFFLFPSMLSILLSLFRYKGYGKAVFVGMENYIRLLTYGHFWETVGTTFFYYVAHLVPVFVFPFLIALLFTLQRTRFSGFFEAALFIPNIVAVVASALLFKILLATYNGAVNALLGTKIPFLDDPSIMKLGVVALLIWRGFGWFLVVFLAGLTTVREELKEAAKIDGANFLQTTLFVTIPVLKPIFLFALVMDLITSLKVFVEPSLLLATTAGSTVPPQGETIMSILYNNMNAGNYGIASAAGWILFLILSGASILLFRLFDPAGDRR